MSWSSTAAGSAPPRRRAPPAWHRRTRRRPCSEGVAASEFVRSLRDSEGFRLAVVPASERVDLHKLRRLLEAGKELRLASEQEMEAEFPVFELGAIPPLGEMLPAPEIVDRRLLEHARVLCNGGDHEHSLLLDPRDLVRASSAVEADICEE